MCFGKRCITGVNTLSFRRHDTGVLDCVRSGLFMWSFSYGLRHFSIFVDLQYTPLLTFIKVYSLSSFSLSFSRTLLCTGVYLPPSSCDPRPFVRCPLGPLTSLTY